MTDIAKLTVALYASSAQSVSELNKMQREANQWAKGISGSITQAASDMNAQVQKVTQNAAQIGNAIKKSIDNVDQLRQQAASTVGSKLDQLAGSAETLGGQAQQATESAARPIIDFFKEVGQQADQWTQQGPDKQLDLVINKLNELGGNTYKDFFSDLGNSGDQVFKALQQSAGLFGGELGQNLQAGLKDAQSSFDGLISAGQGGWDSLLNVAKPVLKDVLSGINGWVGSIGDTAHEFAGLGESLVSSIGDGTAQATNSVVGLLGDMKDQVSGLLTDGSFSDLFSGLFSGFDSDSLKESQDAISDTLQQTISASQTAADAVVEQEQNKNDQLATQQQAHLDNTASFWQQLTDTSATTADAFNTTWGSAMGAFTNGVGSAVTNALFSQKSFSDSTQDMWKGILATTVSTLLQIGVQELALWATRKLIHGEEKKEQTQQVQATTVNAAMKSFDAMASIPIVGPILGAAAYATTMALGTSAAASIGGMAHDGIDQIPNEGTWLLDRGERVYTQQSANKLDQMYELIRRQNNHATSSSPNQTTVLQVKTMDSRGFDRVLKNNKRAVERMNRRLANDRGKTYA